MADRLDGRLDPGLIAPLFDQFPSMNAPAPAPLPSTHRWQRAHVSVWRNSPSVASTGTIFELDEIETFRKSTPRRDELRHISIKMHRNDVISDLRLLLNVIYTGVGVVGGGDSSSTPASASSISAIFFLKISFSAADIFWYARSTSLFFCSSNRQYAVSYISMGASLSAMSSASSISVHGAIDDCTLLGHDAEHHDPNTATTSLKIVDEPDVIYFNNTVQ